MILRLLMISVCFVLCALASTSSAQNLKSIPIDKDFVVTAARANWAADARDTGKYTFVALHKVVNAGGRTYVCGAIFGGLRLHKKFYRAAQIIASDGTRIKQGLTKFKFYAATGERSFTESRKIGEQKSGRIYSFPSDAAYFKGLTAGCIRSVKGWRDVFADRKSIYTMPARVRVQIYD